MRKKRSKSIWISDCKKLTSGKLEILPDQVPESSDSASEIIMTEVSSCLSSGSSSVSSAQSCTNVLSVTDKSRKPVGSNHMGHRAEAILRVLSVGSASEVKIRELLGDSPSTSKALRMWIPNLSLSLCLCYKTQHLDEYNAVCIALLMWKHVPFDRNKTNSNFLMLIFSNII